MLYTGNTQFSTVNEVNLWKSILNAFQNALINIPLLSILFHKGVNKGGVISGINVSNGNVICGIKVISCSDLSEHYNTISLILSTPPLILCGEQYKT